MPHLSTVLALPISERGVQVSPRDHRVRVFDQHVIKEPRERVNVTQPLSLILIHAHRRGQDMLASLIVAAGAFDEPRQDSLPHLFRPDQNVKRRVNLLINRPRAGFIHVAVRELQHRKTTVHAVSTLIQAGEVVRGDHH